MVILVDRAEVQCNVYQNARIGSGPGGENGKVVKLIDVIVLRA